MVLLTIMIPETLKMVLLLLVGLALVVVGSDILVEGASTIARRSGLSEFVIGLTIVGMGTSAPEMVVSFIGAAQGNADIALGNVVGSNIFNTLLILGLTAILLPIGITSANKKQDIPVNVLITALLILLGLKHTLFGIGADGLSQWDGAIMLILFIAYMIMSFRQKQEPPKETDEVKQRSLWLASLFVLGGIAGLIFGGRMFVNSATGIAKAYHVSDKFIAITLLAGGTSLPELATCVAAAIKKKGQLALGNIIGSNIFNILLILGGSALISPLSFEDITYVDMAALLTSSLALLACCYVGHKNQVDRMNGVILLLIWVAYFSYLFIQM